MAQLEHLIVASWGVDLNEELPTDASVHLEALALVGLFVFSGRGLNDDDLWLVLREPDTAIRLKARGHQLV